MVMRVCRLIALIINTFHLQTVKSKTTRSTQVENTIDLIVLDFIFIVDFTESKMLDMQCIQDVYLRILSKEAESCQQGSITGFLKDAAPPPGV